MPSQSLRMGIGNLQGVFQFTDASNPEKIEEEEFTFELPRIKKFSSVSKQNFNKNQDVQVNDQYGKKVGLNVEV